MVFSVAIDKSKTFNNFFKDISLKKLFLGHNVNIMLLHANSKQFLKKAFSPIPERSIIVCESRRSVITVEVKI